MIEMNERERRTTLTLLTIRSFLYQSNSKLVGDISHLRYCTGNASPSYARDTFIKKLQTGCEISPSQIVIWRPCDINFDMHKAHKSFFIDLVLQILHKVNINNC